MNTKCIVGLLALVAGLLIAVAPAKAATIATFADPTEDGSTPLFTVDLVAGEFSGGWPDTRIGLDLEVEGNTYANAFFELEAVEYTGNLWSGTTEGGEINFFADGDEPDDPDTEPLVRIVFSFAQVSLVGFGANDFFSLDIVQMTGRAIPADLSNETFAFGFANLAPLNGSIANGYTATAAFTSSAVPEPAALSLLALGCMCLVSKTRRGDVKNGSSSQIGIGGETNLGGAKKSMNIEGHEIPVRLFHIVPLRTGE